MKCMVGLLAMVCGTAVLAAGCGGPKLKVVVECGVTLPEDIKALKAVLVAPANQSGTAKVNDYGLELSNQLRSWLFDRLHNFDPHPDLTSEAAISKAIEVGKFSRSDLARAENVMKLAAMVKGADGGIVPPDAFIYGEVNVMVSETKIWTSTRLPGIPVPMPHEQVQRNVSASASLHMNSVKTGAVLREKNVLVSPRWLGNELSTVNRAIADCVRQFGETIVPCSVRGVYQVKLAGGDDKNLKDGLTFVKGGNHDAAAGRFEAAAKANPNNHAAHYNLAVMKMLLNDRAAAEASINRAIELRVDEDYVKVQTILRDAGAEERFRKASDQEADEAKRRGTFHKDP